MKNELISIVVPTYKEAANIPILAEQLDTYLKQHYTYEIIIVDDNSQDGTIEAVEPIKKRYNIKLLVRKNEKGLASAVIDGFKLSSGQIIVVMDADLSHPPEKALELINQIAIKNADFSIGSRFVAGGSAPHFNVYRKLNAWISKILALPLARVKDPMAGFFAFNKKNLVIDILSPLGFKICLELLVKLKPQKITEIPIEFKERLHGESKLSLKEQINYVRHLTRLYEFKYKTFTEFVKFSLIGSVGMLIDLSIIYITKEMFGLHFRIARIIGFIFALTSNFLLNRHCNFKGAKNGNIYKQYAQFFSFAIIAFIVNWFISVYLYEHVQFFHTYYLIAAFIGILAGMLINFLGSKKIVFN